jgi:hypothetical protein
MLLRTCLLVLTLVACAHGGSTVDFGGRQRGPVLDPSALWVPLPKYQSRDEQYKARADLLDRANARIDAETAARNGDFRLVGVYGLTIRVPGFPWSRLWRESELKMIYGTSDGIESNAHGRFIGSAHRYAEAYNQVILPLIPKDRFHPPFLRIYFISKGSDVQLPVTEQSIETQGVSCTVLQLPQVEEVHRAFWWHSPTTIEESKFTGTHLILKMVKYDDNIPSEPCLVEDNGHVRGSNGTGVLSQDLMDDLMKQVAAACSH